MWVDRDGNHKFVPADFESMLWVVRTALRASPEDVTNSEVLAEMRSVGYLWRRANAFRAGVNEAAQPVPF